VVEEECVIFPSGTQIEALSKEDSTLRIDWREIRRIDNWQTIIIRFKTPFDKQLLYRGLCEKYLNRIPEFIAGGTYAFTFSVMLNRADLLMNDFKTVFYTNIKIPFNIGIDKKIIENALPADLKGNLVSVSRLALLERKDALQQMNSLNQRITDLEGQEIKDRLPSFVHIESPYGNASIHSIKCKTNPHLIGDGYNLRLPDSFLVEITCSVNAKEQAIKGRIIFHLCELEKFIASTITLLYENSSK
jgi:flagellar biosynthesis regulator FlaF